MDGGLTQIHRKIKPSRTTKAADGVAKLYNSMTTLNASR